MMPQWVGWIIGPGCLAFFLLVVVFVAVSGGAEKDRRRHVQRHGDTVVGWLVQANNALFRTGREDLPALVLISPDVRAADGGDGDFFMVALAERVMALKGETGADVDEAFVSGLVTDERYREGKRDKLPASFAGERTVYLAHVEVRRGHLPGRRITLPYLFCRVIWDEPGTAIFTQPYSPPSAAH